MGRIVSKLDLEYIDGKRWLVTQRFVYESDLAGRVEAPAGFITDFNSTPRVLWSIIPPCDYGEAGVVHDVLYHEGRTSRLIADQTHREVLRLLGAPGWKVDAYYRGLRAFGWYAWRQHRKAGDGAPPLAAA